MLFRSIPRLNSAAEPPRHHRDKGGETAERSSVVAMNGVESLSLSLCRTWTWFSSPLPLGFGCLGFFQFVFKSHVSDMCLFS